MNRDQIGGNWKQMKGKVKEKWGKLTDDDLTVIEGKADQLAGRIQERYGYDKARAEKEVDEFCEKCCGPVRGASRGAPHPPPRGFASRRDVICTPSSTAVNCDAGNT
jgi:uncharacterized protein YjbJ (UPF0337 family)